MEAADLERSMIEIDKRLLEEESAQSDVSIIDLSIPAPGSVLRQSTPGPSKSITTRQGTVITTVPGPMRTRSSSRQGRSTRGKGKGKARPRFPSHSPSPPPTPTPATTPTPLPLVSQETVQVHPHTTVTAAVQRPATPSYQTVRLL